MSDACESIIERNQLTKDEIDWVVPHQANQRIISAVAQRLDVPLEKVMINIEHYTAFGAGFAWGAVNVKWGYDGKTNNAC